MCGLAGIVRSDACGAGRRGGASAHGRGAIRHRGPDGCGIALDAGAGLVSARLAIFDLPRGWQPLEASPGGGLLVYNGEVYNHPELRAELAARGERFATTCDTEVVLRLLERDGVAALDLLNGQFAIAWWQPAPRRLTLVRDRFGVRPLYYALRRRRNARVRLRGEGAVRVRRGRRRAGPRSASTRSSRSGARARRGRCSPASTRSGPAVSSSGSEGASSRSGRGGRRSTAPVSRPARIWRSSCARVSGCACAPTSLSGTYLSGGLDSSLITALAQQETDHELRTFSIAFADPRYDERVHQEEVARAIGTRHHVVEALPRHIADAFPDVVRHAETPLVRTAPVPLYLLAREVREQGITVVATGEGADELFWGYELFKEVVLRELHRHEPERAVALLDELYA